MSRAIRIVFQTYAVGLLCSVKMDMFSILADLTASLLSILFKQHFERNLLLEEVLNRIRWAKDHFEMPSCSIEPYLGCLFRITRKWHNCCYFFALNISEHIAGKGDLLTSIACSIFQYNTKHSDVITERVHVCMANIFHSDGSSDVFTTSFSLFTWKKRLF